MHVTSIALQREVGYSEISELISSAPARPLFNLYCLVEINAAEMELSLVPLGDWIPLCGLMHFPPDENNNNISVKEHEPKTFLYL